MSSKTGDHASDTSSTSGSKVHGNKGKVKFLCTLCEGNHPVHLCSYLDEAKRMLDNHPTSPQRLPFGYKRLSFNPSLVDKETDPNERLVKPTLSKCESHESIPSQSQVKKRVDLISPLVNRTFC